MKDNVPLRGKIQRLTKVDVNTSQRRRDEGRKIAPS
jgi:hypothetical protein